MIYYAFLSGFMFYGFLQALLQTNWVNTSLAGLFCVTWLIEAFVEKRKKRDFKMTDIITCTTPYCSKTVKTNDFRFLIRSGEKVLQQRIVTYVCNIEGRLIKEESVEWKDIETVDSMEIKDD